MRRYAPSIWHIGAITVEAPKVHLDNLMVTDSATIGVGVVTSDVVLYRVSILRSGLLGVHASYADRLYISRSRIDNNNTEQFNSAPVSGGIKSGRTRTLTVVNSSVSNNLGQGYWSDESVYDEDPQQQPGRQPGRRGLPRDLRTRHHRQQHHLRQRR